MCYRKTNMHVSFVHSNVIMIVMQVDHICISHAWKGSKVAALADSGCAYKWLVSEISWMQLLFQVHPNLLYFQYLVLPNDWKTVHVNVLFFHTLLYKSNYLDVSLHWRKLGFLSLKTEACLICIIWSWLTLAMCICLIFYTDPERLI